MLAKKYLVSLIILLTLPTIGLAAPRVASTIGPVHYLVSTVCQGVLEPMLPATGASCIHDCALKPSDVARLDTANIVFYIDDNLESFTKKLSYRDKKLIRLSDEVEILYGREDHSDRHRKRSKDFHIWLNPDNAKKMIEKICAVLCEEDPENAEKYRNNTEVTLAKIETMVEKIRAILEPVKNKPYIVSHDAYQYFDRYFGLNFIYSLSSGHAGVTAKDLSLAKEAAKKHGVKCIFIENQNRPRYSLVSKNIKVHSLDPLGRKVSNNGNGYFELMESLAAEFSKCLKDPSKPGSAH